MDSSINRTISRVRRSDFISWAREVARIMADEGDTESLNLFLSISVRSALFLYLNYDTAYEAAIRFMDTNYVDIDDSIMDIVAVYSDNNEDYYALLRNLDTVALEGSSDQNVDRIVNNQRVAEIYLDSDLALSDYDGTTFLRDLPLMEGFAQELGHPYDTEINYWRYH